jgi:alpha-N-arabinofuranosidase
MRAAVGDAAWMIEMERNADLVIMNCYAPLLVNVNPGARQWRPNLIGYDALRVYGSPSYHAIKLFATRLGDEILKASATDTDVLVSVTRDSRSRMLYVKLVNPGNAAAPVQLDITGATLRPTATALTLAGDAQATNSIDAPDRVVPVSSEVSDVKPGFTYTVPANGIVVLMLETR